MTLTADQILALAPDAASAKAASSQASAAKWSGLGGHALALWGLCQGSGKEPYRAQIDLAGPAFKCSCPSRKFPCKHGLGLFLLYARDAGAFAQADAPAWVSDWLQSREQRGEKKAAKLADNEALTPEQRAAKEQRQQERIDKRQEALASGLDMLDTWLADLARDGLAGLRTRPAGDLEAIASRLVDTQAAGLAARVRRAGLLIATGAAAPELPAARELGRLVLLSQGYRRLERLPPALQEDIKSAVGWVVQQDAVLAQAGQRDDWLVCGNHTVHDQRISRRACYLRGRESGRWAMLLQFSAGTQPLPPPMPAGAWQHGVLHFYPGAWPLRAVFGTDVQMRAAGDWPPAAASLDHILHEYASALAANPFIEDFPMQLDDASPQLDSGRLIVRTGDGYALPVDAAFRHTWQLLAVTGGAAASLFGLWNGETLLPLTVLCAGRLHQFDGELPA